MVDSSRVCVLVHQMMWIRKHGGQINSPIKETVSTLLALASGGNINSLDRILIL